MFLVKDESTKYLNVVIDFFRKRIITQIDVYSLFNVRGLLGVTNTVLRNEFSRHFKPLLSLCALRNCVSSRPDYIPVLCTSLALIKGNPSKVMIGNIILFRRRAQSGDQQNVSNIILFSADLKTDVCLKCNNVITRDKKKTPLQQSKQSHRESIQRSRNASLN